VAAITAIETAKPVVQSATLKFNRTELDFLRTALKRTYKADVDIYPFNGIEHKLYAAIDNAYNGRG